jgi:hypothetical protein
VNTWGFTLVAWASSIIMIILTLILVYTSIFPPPGGGTAGAILQHLHFHWPRL